MAMTATEPEWTVEKTGADTRERRRCPVCGDSYDMTMHSYLGETDAAFYRHGTDPFHELCIEYPNGDVAERETGYDPE